MANRVDDNGLLYILQKIKGLFVQKETGKGLSSNDYTSAEKTKLGGVATGAQVNVLEGIQVNGVDQTISGKKVNLAVPVVDADLSGSSTNAIRNSTVKGALDLKAPLASPAFTGNPTVPTQATSDNSTKAASTAYVKAAIADALSGKIDLAFSFVETLPVTGVVGTFYFVPATNAEADVDEFEEYVWNQSESRFERVGAAKVDLTNYFNTTNLPAISNAEIDTIVSNAMS
jgi:hypothetical protein